MIRALNKTKQKLLAAAYPLLMLAGKRKKSFSKIAKSAVQPVTSIYDLGFTDITGQYISMKNFKDKNLVLVNSASDCGFTGQYSELEKLARSFQETVVVVAFPANDFKEQERANNSTIEQFCRSNYGHTIVLAAKSSVVKGKDQNNIFNWLTNSKLNGWNDMQPGWNFYKYVVNKKGSLTHVFGSAISPLATTFTKALEPKK